MHFAASALVAESMKNPSKYFRNNIANGLNLLDAMITTGVKQIVFSSTCAIFGPPERVPIDETLPQRPINPYGESKLAFEKILRWYGEIHGLRFVSLRYFNAAGASEKFGEEHRVETHLIPNVLKVALGQKPHDLAQQVLVPWTIPFHAARPARVFLGRLSRATARGRPAGRPGLNPRPRRRCRPWH